MSYSNNNQTVIAYDAACLPSEITRFDAAVLGAHARELWDRYWSADESIDQEEVRRDATAFVQAASDCIIQIIDAAGGKINRRFCESGYRVRSWPGLLRGKEDRYVSYNVNTAAYPSEYVWMPGQPRSESFYHPEYYNRKLYPCSFPAILRELASGEILNDIQASLDGCPFEQPDYCKAIDDFDAAAIQAQAFELELNYENAETDDCKEEARQAIIEFASRFTEQVTVIIAAIGKGGSLSSRRAIGGGYAVGLRQDLIPGNKVLRMYHNINNDKPPSEVVWVPEHFATFKLADQNLQVSSAFAQTADGIVREVADCDLVFNIQVAIIDFKLHIPDCDTVYVQACAKRILGHLDRPKTEDRRFEVVERRRQLVSLAIYLANKVNCIASKIAALQRGIVDDDYSQVPDTFAAGNVANLDDAVNLDSALQALRELEQGISLIELDQIHKDCFSEMTKPIVDRVELYRAVPNASAMALNQSNSPDIPCQQQKCV